MKTKVITKVLKVSDNTKEKMIEYFNDKKREKTPPYAIFQADEADTVVTLYESGKVVFQGISADIDANMWNEMEMHLNGKNGLIEKKEKEKEKKDESEIPFYISSIGSDEVGTGDYFGPIVVTASYVSRENIEFLLNLKVKDSKKMTDQDIKRIVPQIVKKIPYKSYILSNKEYNNHHDKINMNKTKAILHNKVLSDLINNYHFDYKYIVIDQFEPSYAYYNHLKEVPNVVKNITFVTKGEDKCLSVACSSLISRYIFLNERTRLEQELGISLPLGASPNVDELGKEIVKKFGEDKLKEIAKYSFANTNKILK